VRASSKKDMGKDWSNTIRKQGPIEERIRRPVPRRREAERRQAAQREGDRRRVRVLVAERGVLAKSYLLTMKEKRNFEKKPG